MSTIWGAIHDTLAGNAALTALLATSIGSDGGPAIWYSRTPRHQGMPYINYWFPGGPGPSYQAPAGPPGTPKLAPYYEDFQMQIECWAEDPDVCNTISGLLTATLDFAKPAIDLQTSVVWIRRASPAFPIDLEEDPDESATDVWNSAFTYDIRLEVHP